MWKIIYRDIQGDKEFSIDNQEYEEIVKFLNKPKMIRLKSGIVLNMSFIKLIEPLPEQQVIPKEFRLPQAGDSTVDEKDKPVRVRGGWQKPSVRENMIRLFNRMKGQGAFKGFKTYQDWEAAKYGKQAC